MKNTRRISWGWLGKNLKKQFLTGVAATIPITATILILVWLFNTIDNVLQPVIRIILGHSAPGIGFAVTIILIYLIGVIASNVFGKWLIRYGESLLARVPVVRPLYSTIKQLLESFSEPGKSGLRQAVLLEFPRKGIWTIGFITKEIPTQSGELQLNIFIPTSPNPTSGFLQIAKESEVIRTDIPINEALKMVISAGKVSPGEIGNKLSPKAG